MALAIYGLLRCIKIEPLSLGSNVFNLSSLILCDVIDRGLTSFESGSLIS